ncbi:hypothetical protein A2Z33_05830 [Candidatus Gottesmanbacteria bacterium RBG_16_52_11]|uniref:Uncharacterized protein n=1 Tax=Candidatus Gottesmanbacteria bacterium RBG_16_52_11 TaxID=1798374 RepID=A0A1F5YX91_9BACT|nr:MAG: hypothetical protein A2Z33_05830 [Candidatus Gottesmanbacteria bacterium RBG_16_52_11]
MAQESEFHIGRARHIWGSRDISRYAEALPAYTEGLEAMAQTLAAEETDGILALGYSAKDMVADLDQVAARLQIQIPRITGIVGQPAWNLYSGGQLAIEQYERLGILFRNPVIIDDFAETARKITDLHKVFRAFDIPDRYVVLYVNPEARERFISLGIRVRSIIPGENPQLLDLLKQRRSPSSMT